MRRLWTLTTLAHERVTRAVRTARALADMAAQVLDWERAHRALAAAEHDRKEASPPAGPPSVRRMRAESPRVEDAPLVTPGGGGEPGERFRDTLAAGHAPRVAVLGPDDTLVSLSSPAVDTAERERDRARAPHG